MFKSFLLPVSLSLLTTVAAQLPVISINVAGQPAAAAQTPGAPAPAAASAAPVAAPTNAGIGANGANGAAGSGVPVWVVKVGSENNDLVFSPNSIQAKPGDMVQFQFFSKNHSVAASTFDQPCVPLMMSQPTAQNAFWSGFIPTEAQGQTTFTLPIRDTNPVWFYCTQGKHCQAGMVGVVNPPANSPETLQAYAAKAAQAPENISPNLGAAAQQAPPGSPAGGQIGTTPTQTGTVAQATRNAADAVRRSAWELVGAAAAVWLLL